jgi:hypothetical protein
MPSLAEPIHQSEIAVVAPSVNLNEVSGFWMHSSIQCSQKALATPFASLGSTGITERNVVRGQDFIWMYKLVLG